MFLIHKHFDVAPPPDVREDGSSDSPLMDAGKWSQFFLCISQTSLSFISSSHHAFFAASVFLLHRSSCFPAAKYFTSCFSLG